MRDSQDIETATTAIEIPKPGQPDRKTRRYDRQLRLWAATGQSSLESSRVLVLGGSATLTSVLKNLVLPGIGHFTILDSEKVTPEDAGNNFFLEGPDSIGKSRAEEAVRLLAELNEGVEGRADTTELDDILSTNLSYLTSFNLLIAHNLNPHHLEKLSTFLWSDPSFPPLMVIRSAGFLAEVFIQFHEHTIIDTHTETPPSLRIDKPFPALVEHALSLDFDGLDVTDHSHIPYVVILVRAMHSWKATHHGLPPKTLSEKKEFKKSILAMKKKLDEDNFDEAESQAYRVWTDTAVPSEISSLFSDPAVASLSPSSQPFFHLLAALRDFTQQAPHTLPLSAVLPDMKSDTKNYVHLQTLYKTRAEEEKATFKGLVRARGVTVDDAIVDEFVRNAHGIKILRGTQWGALDKDAAALAETLSDPERAKHTATHLALSAISSFQVSHPNNAPTIQDLRGIVLDMVGQNTELPSEFDDAIGEVVRAPTADMPNTAAFLGGLVAQEAIKMITRQYVPVKGYCVVDLVGSWTGVVGA